MQSNTLQVSPELQAQYRKTMEAASALAQNTAALVAMAPEPRSDVVQVHVYEFNRRLEDAMHRVSDIMVAVAQQNPATVQGQVDRALESGNIKLVQ